MGEGVTYGGLPFPSTVCPVPHSGNKYLTIIHNEMINVWGIVSTLIHLPGMFFSTDFSSNNG